MLPQALAEAIVSGHFSNSSLLLHLDQALEQLQRDNERHKLLISLIESLPLLRVGYVSWSYDMELEKLAKRPVR